MAPVFVWWCLVYMSPIMGLECHSAHLTDRECWSAFSAAPTNGPHDYPVGCKKVRSERDTPELRRRLGFYDRREVI